MPPSVEVPPEERETRALGRAFAYLGYQLLIVCVVAAWIVKERDHIPTALYVVSFVGGFVLIVWLSSSIRRGDLGFAQILLTLFSATEGVFFGSVAQGVGVGPLLSAFGIAAAIAFGMALMGYLNPRDMAGLGPVLMLSLIGLLILAIVSLFVDFEGLDPLWTALGLVLFSVYTAYDVNQIRYRAREAETDRKLSLLAINGSVDIYLDLANLVVEVLRFSESS